jgi:putative hydrolase of the HAD superfamily
VSDVEVVISDFGGVLTAPLFGAFAAWQEHAGVPLEALGQAMALAAERNGGENPLFPLERGEITEVVFLEHVGAALRETAGRTIDMTGFKEVFFRSLPANEPMFDHLRTLRDEGYRLALLTNNVREWEPLWRSLLPIDDIFELVVDSAFVGVRKPDVAIYQLTLERLGGVAAERCVFLDDMELNVEAARALGMGGVVFRDTEQAIAELDTLLGR